jgi:HSP20 family protein
MPEVAVSKKPSEPTALGRPSEWVRSMFPLSRTWGLNPFSMMRELTNEMDQMFRGVSTGTEIQAWAPAVDIQQCNGNLVVSAELPGLKKEEVKVEVTDNALEIEGERKQEHKEDHDGYHRWERSYGRFYRAIPLPEGAKTDQVKAELKEGVLKISIPVPESAKKTRQVTVTS